jgi:hypothetical protein
MITDTPHIRNSMATRASRAPAEERADKDAMQRYGGASGNSPKRPRRSRPGATARASSNSPRRPRRPRPGYSEGIEQPPETPEKTAAQPSYGNRRKAAP